MIFFFTFFSFGYWSLTILIIMCQLHLLINISYAEYNLYIFFFIRKYQLYIEFFYKCHASKIFKKNLGHDFFFLYWFPLSKILGSTRKIGGVEEDGFFFYVAWLRKKKFRKMGQTYTIYNIFLLISLSLFISYLFILN